MVSVSRQSGLAGSKKTNKEERRPCLSRWRIQDWMTITMYLKLIPTVVTEIDQRLNWRRQFRTETTAVPMRLVKLVELAGLECDCLGCTGMGAHPDEKRSAV
jgi:hypothetical protein